MKISSRVLLSTIILSFFVSFLQAQNLTDLRRANKEYELHAYNLAIQSYMKILQRRPNNPDILVKVADSYRHLNQMEKAREFYDRAIGQNKVDPIAYLDYGKVMMALGRYDEAYNLFMNYARVNNMVGKHYADNCNFAKSQLGIGSSYLVSNEFINSSSSDFGVSFYGDQVIFSSARTDIQRSSSSWTGKAYNQLFRAKPGDNGFLQQAIFMKNSLKNEYNVGPLAFSPDYKTVVYTKNNFVDGTRHIATSGMELSMYVAQVNANGDWVDARAFPFNSPNYNTGFPSFSPDGNALYFSSDRADGYGGYDLYVSYYLNDRWSAPENLGPVVNSPGDEISPYFDGNNLFFSSDWHPGFGGYDVFRAERSGQRFSRIFHLGNAVNSPRDDYNFIYDSFKNQGYLTSNRAGGRGNEDVYKVFKSADNIVIRVKNAADGRPLSNALVDFSDCKEGTYRTDGAGLYSFQAVQGLDCNVVVKKEGYNTNSVRVTTVGLRQKREIEVTLSKVGEEYLGRIVSYTSRQPVAGVTVIATNTATNSSTRSQTDVNGDYGLALLPNSFYIVRYSRPGYREVERNVRTKGKDDRGILGIISLLPTAINPNDAVTDPDDPFRNDDPFEPEPDREKTVQSGYAIQVAAIGSPVLESFSNLRSLGQVYYKQDGSRYKIRLGVYGTRSEAERILRAAKSQGYTGAFIVQEEGVVTNEKGGNDSFTPKGSSPYKVQLAAYTNDRWFDPTPIRDLGTIEERRKGKYIVKYLTGFESENAARSALRRAKSAGFNTAFLVVEENGELIKIK